ncbi:hypothetical protein M5W75_08965 [Paenibacillus larvae]|uniref:hypothetical protein n=1 Tax=Paenibacillus larvae TaxID=1464 RepID=UPI002283045C|nr:hypothetical protein [Paenibacillus larvae]MCY9749971.1 hypothetical protein [Paenibacillus larvae]
MNWIVGELSECKKAAAGWNDRLAASFLFHSSVYYFHAPRAQADRMKLSWAEHQ